MRRANFVILGLVFVATATFGQAPSTDSQTLQALLKEVRELRQDLRTSLVNTQRAQLLFYRMQAERAAVGMAQQRVDGAQNALDKAQKNRKDLEVQYNYYADLDTEDKTPDPTERKRLEDGLPRMKANFESAEAAEQMAQGNVMQAKDQLQIEQGKLEGLQEELERIDKSLEELAKQPGN